MGIAGWVEPWSAQAAPDDRLGASRDDNNTVPATDYTRDLKSSKDQ
jgi:hypothetical protein